MGLFKDFLKLFRNYHIMETCIFQFINSQGVVNTFEVDYTHVEAREVISQSGQPKDISFLFENMWFVLIVTFIINLESHHQYKPHIFK